MKIIGHRGVAGKALENSFESFDLAYKLELELFEVDIQLTKDNIPVVYHDLNLSRCTNSQEFINQLTYNELNKSVRLKNGERIPSLIELCLLNENRKQKLIFEIKNQTATEYVYEIIKNFDKSKFIISSFFHSVVLNIKKIDNKLTTSAIFECVPIDIENFLKNTKSDIASIGIDSCSKEMVKEIKKAGLKCYAWTVNSYEEYEMCIEYEIDGIYTNYPEKFINSR